MEYLRKSKLLTPYSIFFIGTLISDTSLLVGFSIIQLDMPLLPSLILITIFSIMAIIGAIMRKISSKPQVILVVNNFLFLPIGMIICKDAAIKYFVKNERKIEIVLILINFCVVMSIGILHSILIPLKFVTNNKQWSLNSVSKIYPLFRVLRILVLILLSILTNLNTFILGNGLLIFVNTLIIVFDVNYQNPKQCSLLFLTSFSAILSFFESYFAYSSSLNYYFISQILCILIYLTSCIDNILLKSMQIKYGYYFKKSTKNLTQLQSILLFMLLQQTIFDDKDYLQNHHFKFKWSQSFKAFINKLYLQVIRKYLKKINTKCNRQSKLVQMFQQTCLLDQQKNVQNYSSDYQVFIDVAQCILFKIHNKDDKKIDNLVFFVSLIKKGNFNSFKKALFYYYSIILNQKSLNFFQQVLTKEIKQMINQKILFYKEKNSEYQNIMIIQTKIKQVKDQFVHICKNQEQIMKGMISKQKNVLSFKDNILDRYQKKKAISKKIQTIMKTKYSYYFNEFFYMYLLFKINFCKEIETSKYFFRKNFLIPRLNKSQENLKVDQVILAVCSSGLGEKKTQGLIVNGNQPFRKTFSIKYQQMKKKKININHFIPKINEKNHSLLFLQSLKFDAGQKKLHQQLDCYIKSPTDKIGFIKKCKISTKIYFDYSQSINFICEFKFDQDSFLSKNYLIEKSNKDLLRHYDLDYDIQNEFSVNQLSQTLQMLLVQINTNIFVFGHQIQTKNDQLSLKTNFSQNPVQQNIVESYQNQKFSKIEQRISKHSTKKINFLTTLFFKIIVLIACCLAVYFLSMNTQQKISIAKQFVSMQKMILKQLALSQQKIGYLLMLKKEVQLQNIPIQVCEKFEILNLKNFIIDKLEDIYQNQFDKFESNLHYTNSNQIQILNILNERRFKYFQIQMPDFKITMSKYFALMKSFVVYNIYTSWGELILDQKIHFVEKIKQLIQLGDISSQNQYPQVIAQFNNNFIQQFQDSVQLFFLIKALFFLMTFGIIIFLIIRSQLVSYKYFTILDKINSQYFLDRLREIEYIKHKINQIQNNQLELCQITSTSHIIIKNKNSDQAIMTVEQFQKTAAKQKEYTDFQRKMVNKYQKQRNTFLQLIQLKKLAFGTYFFFIFILYGFHFYSMDHNIDSFSDIRKYSNFIRQLTKTGQNLLQLNIVNINSKIRQKYLQDNQSKMIFNSSFEQIRTNQLKELATIFSNQIISQIMFDSIWNIIHSNNVEHDKSLLGGVLGLGMNQLIAFQQKNSLIDNINQFKNDTIMTNRHCENLVLFFNYTQQAFKQYIEIGFESVFNILQQNKEFIQGLEWIINCSLILFILIEGIIANKDVCIIQHEVLTFDTPKDLYEHEVYRPYLNYLLRQR